MQPHCNGKNNYSIPNIKISSPKIRGEQLTVRPTMQKVKDGFSSQEKLLL